MRVAKKKILVTLQTRRSLRIEAPLPLVEICVIGEGHGG
jgi:hypothetical protein